MTAIKDTSSNQINKKIIETRCPVTFTLHKMGGRWKPLIINQLFSGEKRYSELKKAIPAMTEKMLIQSLKELETDDIIIRKAITIIPPHVEYTLSACGKELITVLSAMVDWGLKYNTSLPQNQQKLSGKIS